MEVTTNLHLPRIEFPDEARDVIHQRDAEIRNLKAQIQELQQALAAEAAQHGGTMKDRDIAQKEKEEALELAGKDPLTELLNRRKAREYADELLKLTARGKITLAYIRLDVDHFKLINDTNGHPWGDQVLMRVAEKLKATKRDTDIASRYGGEEFDLALPLDPNINLQDIGHIVSRYLKALYDIPRDDPSSHKTVEKLTASFGVAVVRSGNKFSFDAVSRLADEALYIAKSNGRDQIQIADAEEHAKGNVSYFMQPKEREILPIQQ